MPLSTKMFDWHDHEFKIADEIYLAVIGVITLWMVIGYFIWLRGL